MDISDDSFAMLLLCSDLALKKTETNLNAYTAIQWSKLAQRLIENKLTPSALFDISSENIKEKLNLPVDEVKRIEKLLSLSGRIGIELSALNDKGIFTLTRGDKNYPAVLKNKLKQLAPPILYYAGNMSLLLSKGVAIIGSRDIDTSATNFTERLSKRCSNDGLNIISGGARGVDLIAEKTANASDGKTVIVVADNMEKKIRNKETREAIMRNQSVILSPFRPDMPFQTYAAMERNKYIYALSNFAVVIASDYNKGGTWAGAQDNLKRGLVPMFVRKADDVPLGNINLLKEENIYPITEEILDLDDINIYDWFQSQSKINKNHDIKPQQITLFET